MFVSGCNSIVCLFESKTESESTAELKTECGAYFTVVDSHGAAYFTICVKTQIARVNA